MIIFCISTVSATLGRFHAENNILSPKRNQAATFRTCEDSVRFRKSVRCWRSYESIVDTAVIYSDNKVKIISRKDAQ